MLISELAYLTWTSFPLSPKINAIGYPVVGFAMTAIFVITGVASQLTGWLTEWIGKVINSCIEDAL